ncbi:MAG: flagellin [Bryobacteraceae bacterium]
MGFTINTNIASLQAQSYLRTNSQFQAKTIQEVTSGLRIVNSGDDAAGLAIANGYRSDEAVLSQGILNANSGLSQLQIIDGGVSNISQLLDRASTLATESASGTFTGDRNVLNSEFQSVLGEINRQAQAIGLNTGGNLAKNLQVFIGGGQTSNGISAINNGSVSVNLSQSTVDAKSLGLQGVQSSGIAGTDIGTGAPSTNVQQIVNDAVNKGSEAVAGSTVFSFTGPGFGGANKINVAVNLNGVTDANTLVTAINNAIQAAGNGNSQASTAFKNANITAAVNIDASGKSQLTFQSSNAAFQTAAGDRVANALLGNFGFTGADTGHTLATGKSLVGTVTGPAIVDATGTDTLAQNTIIRIQGSGLAAPVDLQIASGTTVAASLTSLSSLVANNSQLQAAGISLATAGGGSALVFTNSNGEQFNVSAVGDTANRLGLGTFQNATTNGTSYDYNTITGAAATGATTKTDNLEISVGGAQAVAISVTSIATDTVQNLTDALNTAISGSSTLLAAGLHATLSAGNITLASSNGTSFRINDTSIAASGILGFGSVGVASGANSTVASVATDNTANAHFEAGGATATKVYAFNPIINGQDNQTISFTATDPSGAQHSTQVVLSDNGATQNAQSIDQAINTINNQLQQSNDPFLNQIVAVKDYTNTGSPYNAQGIKFVSTLNNFNVSLSAAGTGGAVGVGAAADQGQVTSAAVSGGGSTANISNQTTAEAAVTALFSSVTLLGSAQAVVGKGENVFNYAINLAQSQVTNLASAQSGIRDADLAAQAANLTKAQILVQAGVAALAQANSAPQAILSLLKA